MANRDPADARAVASQSVISAPATLHEAHVPALADLFDERVVSIVDRAIEAVRARNEQERRACEIREDERRALLEGTRARVGQVFEEARVRERKLADELATLRARLEQAARQYEQAYTELIRYLQRRHREHRKAVEEAKRAYREGVWESSALHEAIKSGVEADLTTYGAELDELRAQARAAKQKALRLAGDWNISSLDVPPLVTEPAATATELRMALEGRAQNLEQLLEQARNYPRIGPHGLVAIGTAAALGIAVGAAVAITSGSVAGLLIGLTSTPLAGGIAAFGAYLWNRRQLRRLLSEIVRNAEWVDANTQACKKMLYIEGEQRIRDDRERHRTEVERLKERLRADLAEARAALARSREEVRNVRLVELRNMQQNVETTRAELDRRAREGYQSIRTWRREELLRIKQAFRQKASDLEDQYRQELKRVKDEFQGQLKLIHRMAEDLWSRARADFPSWEDIRAEGWCPSDSPLKAVYVGSLRFCLEQVPGFDSSWVVDPALATVKLPALLRCPIPRTLLVHCRRDSTLTRAVLDWFSAVAARYLMALPPASARLLILDPLNMGASFGGFMHLSDYDRRLISGRIWTTRTDVENQVHQLFEDLETLLQTCLRNEYDSIEEYNATAGELAEPYRLVLLTDFPDGLSDPAIEELRTITENARRCGTSLLLLAGDDDGNPLQRASTVASLRLDEDATVSFRRGEFPILFSPEPAPPADVLTAIVRTVGQQALERGRVEVPLERVIPPRDRWWTESTREELRIPLGLRPGHAVQELCLGRGTSQHVLVAGRTGSGKSNLLHVLIISGCLKYSPDELELFLVDFKKGVEFKSYATWQLPHARVVAIESEREFGLSVLQQLDREMQRRGELFRAAGVQDISEYRRQQPDARMPRILLVVDEFQEFFVEEDDVARQASLLLDRLVRQGRAFGIHVLLGSQTLSGTYSLARSTISQMGVRIALQCSESDAHLILAEDNPAARLLHRPGDAIYNDANGLKEGNHRFQIAWLPPAKREFYLQSLTELATSRGISRTEELVVFEGNVPAHFLRNRLFQQLLDQKTWQPGRDELDLWPGESVAVPEPVSVRLARETASNVLVVGQDPDLVGAMFVSMLLAASAQLPPAEGEMRGPLFVIDAAPSERTLRPRWEYLLRELPQGLTLAGRPEAGELIDRLVDELDRRLEAGGDHPLPWILFVFDLAQLRALQYTDDLFGFGGGSVDSTRDNRAHRWQRLLAEGPGVGLHTIVWCDSPANVWRMLTRTLLREFSWRIALQMNVNDSTSLLDTPAAARLGPNRALLYAEQTGTHAKFRPYGPLSDEELHQICSRIREFCVREESRGN